MNRSHCVTLRKLSNTSDYTPSILHYGPNTRKTKRCRKKIRITHSLASQFQRIFLISLSEKWVQYFLRKQTGLRQLLRSYNKNLLLVKCDDAFLYFTIVIWVDTCYCYWLFKVLMENTFKNQQKNLLSIHHFDFTGRISICNRGLPWAIRLLNAQLVLDEVPKQKMNSG